jgi:hypothetical protein
MTPAEFQFALEGKREDDKRQRYERRNAVIAILQGLGEKTTVRKLTELIVGADEAGPEEEDEIMAISEERAYQARKRKHGRSR